MKHFKRMVVLSLLLPLLLPTPLYAEDSNEVQAEVLIVELQTRSAGGTDAAKQEFIELYNTTGNEIDLSGWKIEFKSATGETWTTKLNLEGTLWPHGRLLLASNDYLSETANQHFSPGFTDNGGHLRLVSKDTSGKNVVTDTLGWGKSASAPEGNAAPGLMAGASLQRKISEKGHYIDTNDNSQDFAVNAASTPESANEKPDSFSTPLPPAIDDPMQKVPDPSQPETQEPDPTLTPSEPLPAEESEVPDSTVPEQIETVSLLPLQITELLPNPAPPLTDNENEFVEIYNPNDRAISLENYVIKTGVKSTYRFSLDGMTINPRSYLVVTSGDSSLSLANTEGVASLFSSEDVLVIESDPYQMAPEGAAWALTGQGWQWTMTATPGRANMLTSLTPPPPTTPKTSSLKPKPAVAPRKSSLTPAKVKSATSTKSTKSPQKKTSSTSKKPEVQQAATLSPGSNTVEVPPVIHPLILATITGIALVYAGYEYRQDVANRIYQFRTNRTARRAARPKSPRR